MLLVFILIKNFLEKVNELFFLYNIISNEFYLGTGATISMAEEMAARDALRRLFETDEKRAPIPFDKLYKSGLLIDK